MGNQKPLSQLYDNTDRANRLPLVMLGLRITISQDIGCCPAELFFGTTLHLNKRLVSYFDVVVCPAVHVKCIYNNFKTDNLQQNA